MKLHDLGFRQVNIRPLSRTGWFPGDVYTFRGPLLLRYDGLFEEYFTFMAVKELGECYEMVGLPLVTDPLPQRHLPFFFSRLLRLAESALAASLWRAECAATA